LETGHNAPYWVEKIRRNFERDRHHDAALAADGWMVLRFWETDVLKEPDSVAHHVLREVRLRRAA
jgi:DNA mismatch endonuclease (patch repair protein)